MKSAAAACGLGLLSVVGFAPFYVFPLPIVALALVLAMVERTALVRTRFAVGFAYGAGLFLAGVSWVYVSLHDFGLMPAPIAVGVTLLFCAYLALFPACALLLASYAASPLVRRCLALPAAWVLSEWVRGWLFTGFPWLALGYSQAPLSPLSGLAPLAGVYGVGLATVASAGLMVHAYALGKRRAGRALAGLALLWGIAWGLTFVEWTEPSGEPVSVSLLQGNVPQEMKWRPEVVAGTLQHYEQMIRATRARLVVLPETAVPLFWQDVPVEYLDGISAHARANGADVLIGVPERAGGQGYFNSVISIGASPIQAYRKSHLVPFGEFIPLRPVLAPVVQALAIPLTDFSRGDIAQRPLAVAGQKIAVNICYEDAFGEEIIRQLPEATVLVNVSNVAWFGDSLAPMQHLQIAQMRSIETGRHMLRATNTGMTAVIDPRGRILRVAPTFQTAAVEASIAGHTGATPYVQVGNAPVLGLSAALIAIALVPRRRTI